MTGLRITDVDAFESVRAVHADDLDPGAHLNVRRVVNPLYEIVRHRLSQRVRAHENGDLPRVPGKEQRALAGRVGAADDDPDDPRTPPAGEDLRDWFDAAVAERRPDDR